MNYLISTITTETRCHRCRQPILTALADGLNTRVDATPLPDHQAELIALLANLRTYTHVAKQLIERDISHLAAGMPYRGSIHAQHKCTGPQQLTLDGNE